MEPKTPMSDLLRLHAALLATGIVSFILMGAGQSLYGPALPAFGRLFALTDVQAGLLVSAHWVGCFVGILMMFRWGSQVTPRLCLGLMTLGAAAVATLAAWAVVLAGAVIFGVGYGMATAVFNPRVLTAFQGRGPSMLSMLNAMFGIGAIASPLVFVWLGSDPAWTFGLTAGLLALATLAAGAASRAPAAAPGSARPFRLHLPILGFGALAIGMEACLIGLGPTALIASGVAEDRAAGLLSAFFLVFLGSRLGLIFLADRLPSFWLFTGAVGLTATLAVLAALGPAGAAFVVIGLAAGVYFPSFYVTASRKMGTDGRVPPTIIIAGLVGGILMPLVIAPVMDDLGDRGFFWIIAGLSGLAALLALTQLREMSRG